MKNSMSAFKEISALLRKNSKGLALRKTTIDPNAKIYKPALHLYGKKEIAIGNRKPQLTYVVGIIEQKHFTGFYSMPVYSHRKEFKLSPELGKTLKGKSCFNIRKLTPEILKELDGVIKKGIQIYKKEGWI